MQAGYTYVMSMGLILGLEADFSFPDKMGGNLPPIFSTAGPSIVSDHIESFGSLSGRIGYARAFSQACVLAVRDRLR
jgi:hypothetical protein